MMTMIMIMIIMIIIFILRLSQSNSKSLQLSRIFCSFQVDINNDGMCKILKCSFDTQFLQSSFQAFGNFSNSTTTPLPFHSTAFSALWKHNLWKVIVYLFTFLLFHTVRITISQSANFLH